MIQDLIKFLAAIAPEGLIFYKQRRKIRRGKSQKMQRTVFSGGAQRVQAPARRRGCNLAIFLKIGSSLVVHRHQIATFCGIIAHAGDFFFGFAEQNPDVFRGESCVWGSRWLRLFGF